MLPLQSNKPQKPPAVQEIKLLKAQYLWHQNVLSALDKKCVNIKDIKNNQKEKKTNK